jgi:hypothetical protein
MSAPLFRDPVSKRVVHADPPLIPLAPGVLERGELGLFGAQKRAPVQREAPAPVRAVQPWLLDVSSADLPGQLSMLDLPGAIGA